MRAPIFCMGRVHNERLGGTQYITLEATNNSSLSRLGQFLPAFENAGARRQAKFLYWMGWRVCEMAEATGQNDKTIHSWKARDD